MGISVAAIANLILITFTIWYYRRYQRLRKNKYFSKDFNKGRPESIDPELTLDEQAHLLPYDNKFEIARNDIRIGKQLGCGEFGVVFKAKAKGISIDDDEITVAVKMVKKPDDYEV